MQFSKPEFLNFLFLLIPLILLLRGARLYRKQKRDALIASNLQESSVGGYELRRAAEKDFILVGALFFSIVALARPQWGFEWQDVRFRGTDILVAVDVSKSMLTRDVVPNRLERTKYAIRDLVQKLHGDRVGLIAFAGDAFLNCPLTNDYGGFLLTLADLSPQSVPRGGTNIGTAIREAVRVYKTSHAKDKSVIIITDGDNLEGDPLAAARDAADQGVKIFCIGIGTPDGELIQVTNDNGQTEYLKNEKGEYVLSRLNGPLLEQIALKSGGVYIKAGAAQFGTDLIYDNYLSKQDQQNFENQKQKKYFERFQYPLVMALILLVGEAVLSYSREKK